MRVHLTELAVRTLKARDRQVTYWDLLFPSFGLRVNPAGRKTWTLMTGKERRRVTLGHWPTISLVEARQAARTFLASHNPRKGGAPVPFQVAITAFLEQHHTRKNRKKTIYLRRRICERFFIPAWENKPIHSIERSDIVQVLDKLSDTPSQAITADSTLKTFFKWAVARGMTTHNPTLNIPVPAKPKSRTRVLSDDELRLIWRICEREAVACAPLGISDGDKPRSLPANYCTIIKLLILTGQRVGEISQLEREWINTDTIAFPKEIIKNKLEHTIPLTPKVKEILDTLPQSGRLFPVRGKVGYYTDFPRPNNTLRKLCKIPHFVPHDFRRTFSTIHARIDTPPYVTEALLNHITGIRTEIERIYNRHTYLPQMRTAMINYEKELTRILALDSP